MEQNMLLSHWVDRLVSQGKNSFSLDDARTAFVNDKEVTLRSKLSRLTQKGKIKSVHKGYYLIITPQYASKGILPPPLFIDGLMKFLERPYYVGLLNAAVFYGAAHQQPQEFFVFTHFPTLRPTIKKNLKINYISKKKIPAPFLEKKKTETGFINVSNPALTALDLVQFDKRIGGLDRSATVLNELADVLKPEYITEHLLKEIPVTTIQRLGFLLEVVLQKDIGSHLYSVSKKAGLEFFRIPLRTTSPKVGFSANERWKIIINTKIEIDE